MPVTRLRRYRARLPFWAIADAPVWYTPPGGGRFAAIIDRNPWLATGAKTWMARLREVEMPGAGGRMTISTVEIAELAPRREEPTR